MTTWKLHGLALAFCLALFPAARAAQTNAAPAKAAADNDTGRDPFATEDTSEGAKKKSPDPLEPMNRAFFKFNDKFYFWALKPVARGYTNVAPRPVRAGVSRFFQNARFPIRFVNNVLEGRLKGAGVETGRFLLNSTVGVAGFLDPAREELKLEPRPADFDLTLGLWGIPPGAYIDWPFLGPSSVRGTVGIGGDMALTPWTYLNPWEASFAITPFDIINESSLRLGEYEDFKKATFDPYVALRDAYLENRRAATKK
jgi:phospholipid-binding lipoprotein MlaA